MPQWKNDVEWKRSGGYVITKSGRKPCIALITLPSDVRTAQTIGGQALGEIARLHTAELCLEICS